MQMEKWLGFCKCGSCLQGISILSKEIAIYNTIEEIVILVFGQIAHPDLLYIYIPYYAKCQKRGAQFQETSEWPFEE